MNLIIKTSVICVHSSYNKNIRQKRESLADTGPWVPGVTPFLFSFWIILILSACSSPKAISEVALTIAQQGTYPTPKLYLSQQAFGAIKQEEWKKCFPVFVGDSLPEGELADYPILGKYIWQNDTLSFQPRLSWQAGQRYFVYVYVQHLYAAAGLTPPARITHLEQRFRFSPIRDTSHASLVALAPATDSLPANALRIYLQFDAPMRQDSVYQYIKLLDEKGEAIPQAFVEAHPPLFDPSGKRLTLIFHPGRVKQGIEFGERVGPVLEAGQKYQLSIDTLWQDKRGRFLHQHEGFPFATKPADRQSPDPDTWKLQLPEKESFEPLMVFFDDQLDAVLVRRMIRVLDEDGQVLNGQIEANSATLTFRPDNPWQAGAYQILIDPRLEDLAGNRPGRLFDSKEGKEEEGEWVIFFEL